MKGHRSVVTFQGHTTAPAERRLTSKTGKYVTSFTIGVGGNKEKGQDGVFIRCRAWEESASIVEDAVKEAGLAVRVTGRLKQKVNQRNGVTYIDNDLDIDKLEVQPSKDVLELIEVKLARNGGDTDKKEGSPVKPDKGSK